MALAFRRSPKLGPDRIVIAHFPRGLVHAPLTREERGRGHRRDDAVVGTGSGRHVGVGMVGHDQSLLGELARPRLGPELRVARGLTATPMALILAESQIALGLVATGYVLWLEVRARAQALSGENGDGSRNSTFRAGLTQEWHRARRSSEGPGAVAP